MRRAAAGANLALRLCVELATFASLAYSGASIQAPPAGRVALTLLLPLAAVAAWSRYLAPKAPRRLDGAKALGLELSIFGAATLALVVAGSADGAVVYGAVALGNSLLIRSLGQYTVGTPVALAGGGSW